MVSNAFSHAAILVLWDREYRSNWEWNEKGELSERDLEVEITGFGNQLNIFRGRGRDLQKA